MSCHVFSMVKQSGSISIAEYLAGEELSDVKHEYLTIPSLKVLILAESESPSVIAYRRKSEGGFAVEAHSGLDAVIPLPVEGGMPHRSAY
jgi:hypothetical protein